MMTDTTTTQTQEATMTQQTTATIDDIEIGSDGSTGAQCDVVRVRWVDDDGVSYSRHPAPYCHECGMRAITGVDGCLVHGDRLIPLDTSEYDDLIVHDC